MTGLHVVYRSYGGENTKGRPDFYTKRLAVISLLRAVADAGRPVELIFLIDGPIPAERLTLMERAGEILDMAQCWQQAFVADRSRPSRSEALAGS